MTALHPIPGGEPHQLVPEAALRRLQTVADSLRLAGSIVAGGGADHRLAAIKADPARLGMLIALHADEIDAALRPTSSVTIMGVGGRPRCLSPH